MIARTWNHSEIFISEALLYIHCVQAGNFFFISSLYDTIGCLTYPDFNIRYYKGTGDTLEIFLDFTNIF